MALAYLGDVGPANLKSMQDALAAKRPQFVQMSNRTAAGTLAKELGQLRDGVPAYGSGKASPFHSIEELVELMLTKDTAQSRLSDLAGGGKRVFDFDYRLVWVDYLKKTDSGSLGRDIVARDDLLYRDRLGISSTCTLLLCRR